MKLTKTDFYKLFDICDCTPLMSKHIDKCDFRYDELSNEETNNTLLQILKKIDSNTLKPTGDLEKWETSWSENLNEFVKTNDINSLIPKYVHPAQICRLNQKYIKTTDSNFELNIFYTLRYWIAETYFKNCNNIFEFGCGSGYNVSEFAKMYPDKNIYGLDWAKSSVEIINKLNIPNAHGYLFDLSKPDYNLNIPNDSCIITFGCLEQLYDKYYDFVNFLINKNPKIICNIEPIEEFYDQENLIDYMALKFHQHRNYLNNYYTHLKDLQDKKKIKILKSTRVKFGSFFHDGWSILIWEIL